MEIEVVIGTLCGEERDRTGRLSWVSNEVLVGRGRAVGGSYGMLDLRLENPLLLRVVLPLFEREWLAIQIAT